MKRVLLIAALFAPLATSATALETDPQLDAGFHHMYELKFDAARAEFSAYQRAHPDDPLGEAAMAASFLFEELNSKGVLTSAFFLDDKKLLGGVEGPADEKRNAAFLGANQRARQMATARLKSNSHDGAGLFVLTLTEGMEADYDALIEKRQFASLHMIRSAESNAATLLAVEPNAQDAYLALGAANYIIGCLPGYKRAFLWFGGIHGDRQRGMSQLQLAAEHGHYLQPFAKVLLALAALREKQLQLARTLFEDLHHEFPTNPVFARELALLQK
jgi:hypothetical protein